MRKRIAAALEAAEDGVDSRDVRPLQKRAIMVVQQFYKTLVSDYSPLEWKEIKNFLRSSDFPELREALRIKPAKLPARLREGLEKLQAPEERKKQLNSILERLEDAVEALDEAIYNSRPLPKRKEKAIERLQQVHDTLENLIAAYRRAAAVESEIGRFSANTLGEDDIERLSAERHRERLANTERLLQEERNSISELERTIEEEMEDLKHYLMGAGEMMHVVVALLQSVRSMTSHVVKIEDEKVTEWELQVMKNQMARFLERLPEGSVLRAAGAEMCESAVDYILSNREMLDEFNDIRHLQTELKERKEKAEKISDSYEREQKMSIREEIAQELKREAESRRMALGKLQEQLKELNEEIAALLAELGIGNGDGVRSLATEIEENIKLL